MLGIRKPVAEAITPATERLRTAILYLALAICSLAMAVLVGSTSRAR